MHVSETQVQMVGLSEAYLMVYRSQAWDPRKYDELETLHESISTGLHIQNGDSNR